MTSMRAACMTILAAVISGTAPQAQTAAVPMQTFVGTWVGTQGWAIATPPPGANPEQPISVQIDIVDGKLTGTLTPFMGGEDGVVFTEATIVGDQLRAAAVFGNPNPDHAPVTEDAGDQQGDFKIVPSNGRSRKQAWKEAINVTFIFTASGVNMKGTGEVTMDEMKWLSFNYDLSKKRARY
jgi:hypothetical protein